MVWPLPSVLLWWSRHRSRWLCRLRRLRARQPGGQVVTVTGTGFAASMTVSLGGTAITPQRITTTSFNITTPAHAAGYDRLQVTTSKGSSALSANSGYVFTSLASYVAVTPFRILDTRARTCVQCGAGGLASNQTRTLQITGVTGLKGGADQVPATATAIVMNVTAVSGRTGGLLTIYPTGTALPRASNLNFNAGTVTPNLVTVTLGQTSAASPNWAVNIFNPIGSLDVVADIEGYFAPNASGDPAGEFHAMSPLRVCDTRAGQAANVCNQGTGTGHRLGPNSVVKVNVSGLPSGVLVLPRASRVTALPRQLSSTSPRPGGHCQRTSACSLRVRTVRVQPHPPHPPSTLMVVRPRRTE